MALSAGTRLGVYEILSLLGVGGMGEVYRAKDTKLGRDVAIKILPEAFAGDPDRRARFEREAKLLAALNHPQIAAIYGIEEAGATSALVMELVDGDTLAEQIARGRIPAEDAFRIAHQITEALEAAHEKGIVHRDLKPANIKITPEGKVKVLDFGLAKVREEASPANSRSPTLSVMATNAGIILGTVGYMSPEQARGHAADQRSDVFSFGCVLYEMLTGRQPFPGETVTDIIAPVVARDPDWRSIPAELNPRTEELIRRCLAKNRKDRWHAIADVRVELEAIMADPHGLKLQAGRTARVTPLWRRAIPHAITAVAVAAVAVAATVVVINPRPGPPAVVMRFPIVLPADHRFVNSARHLITVSPDGSHIVYAANQQLYLRRMGDMEARPIQGTSQNASRPIFAPDGQWVAYVARAENKLKKIAITGGAAVNLCDLQGNVGGFGPIWNTDHYIYIGQLKGIDRVSEKGGNPERIITLKDDEAAHRPQLLPGGDALLFTLETGGASRWDSAQIVVQSLKSGERKVVIPSGSDGRYVPTGHILYALGNTVLAVPFDRKTLTVGGPVPVIEGVGRALVTGRGGADAQFAVADNGVMVYVPGDQTASNDLALLLVDRAGARKPLNVPAGPYRFPTISPDGKRLAVGTDDGKDRIVWIADLLGAAPIRKLTFEGSNENAFWTRDGQRVVYLSTRDGSTALVSQRVDGGPAERVAAVEPGIIYQPGGWSPDGKMLIFSSSRGAGAGAAASISMLSIGADRQPTLVIKPPAFSSSLSPDGRWLAYHGAEPGSRPEVFVQPFPPTGEKHQITTNGGVHPLWSSDGKQLFFLTNAPSGQIMAVDVQIQRGFVAGKTTPLPIEGIVYGAGPRPYDVTPDGQHFVVMVPKAQPTPDKAPPEQINVTLNWFEELKQRVPAK